MRTITIAGRLTAEQIPGLLDLCARPAAVRLDLNDVLAVDPIAADALRRIRDRGARLVGASPYIQLKLDSIA